jgi:hypothetical protein
MVTQAQRSLVEKTRSVGTAKEAEPLSDADCLYLLGVIARDLSILGSFPELEPQEFPEFFVVDLKKRPALTGNFWELFERILDHDPNADTYFSCLGNLYKARLKYANILSLQPIPTMDQVGPRGLLQYGSLPPAALTGLLLWRKWMFDIDNRAGQETGYLFEPIIAFAIGGTPIGSKKSPVRRSKDSSKGRQVDCVRERRAYEFKVRVTIAASGQGRWGEELDFPVDCKNSGFVPVLIVLDPTPNPKLTELSQAFVDAGGESYVGDEAWDHLDTEAGPTMARFLETYVRAPITELLTHVPEKLPVMSLTMTEDAIKITIDGDELHIPRE